MKDIQTKSFGVLFLIDNFQIYLRHHLLLDLKYLYNVVLVNTIVPILASFFFLLKKKGGLQSSSYLRKIWKEKMLWKKSYDQSEH